MSARNDGRPSETDRRSEASNDGRASNLLILISIEFFVAAKSEKSSKTFENS